MNSIHLIMAPMRGVGTAHYRNVFSRHFDGVDSMMAPFIPTVGAERIKPGLLKDVLPENNSGLPLIPQLIGNNAEDFIRMAHALHDLGYNEINWNLGCPHKPIRKKQRGSGLLSHPDIVDALLEQICSDSPCSISVKVRLGVIAQSELMNLIPVLNSYPLSEVIIHPRTAEQMYDGHADLDAFEEAAGALTHPVCYNGDINDLSFFRMVQNRFPAIDHFMLGRGLLANPFLCEEIKESLVPRHKDVKREIISLTGGTPSPASIDSEDAVPPKNHMERIIAFHAELLSSYEAILDGDHPVLGKMKEFWTYQSTHLSNGRQLFKNVKKAQRLPSYKAIVAEYLEKAVWSASAEHHV